MGVFGRSAKERVQNTKIFGKLLCGHSSVDTVHFTASSSLASVEHGGVDIWKTPVFLMFGR